MISQAKLNCPLEYPQYIFCSREGKRVFEYALLSLVLKKSFNTFYNVQKQPFSSWNKIMHAVSKFILLVL